MRRRPHMQTSSLKEWLPPTDDMYHISEYHRLKGVDRGRNKVNCIQQKQDRLKE